MKRYLSLLTASLLAVSASPTFAQGTIVFNNGTGLVTYWSDPFPRGYGFVELFWAPAGTPYTQWTLSMTPSAWYAANPGWSLGPIAGFTTPAAGKFSGGTLTLTPLAPGGTIDYVIAGWVGTSYVTMDAAFAASSPLGVSEKYTTKTGDPTANPAGSPVHLVDTFGGLRIIDVPEPSGFQLAGLAGAVWWGLTPFSRRKSGANGRD